MAIAVSGHVSRLLLRLVLLLPLGTNTTTGDGARIDFQMLIAPMSTVATPYRLKLRADVDNSSHRHRDLIPAPISGATPTCASADTLVSRAPLAVRRCGLPAQQRCFGYSAWQPSRGLLRGSVAYRPLARLSPWPALSLSVCLTAYYLLMSMYGTTV